MRTLHGRLVALVAVAVILASVLTVAVAAVLVGRQVDTQRREVLDRQADALVAVAPVGTHVYRAASARGPAGVGTRVRELGPAAAAKVLAHLPPARPDADGQVRVGAKSLLYASRTTAGSRAVVLRAAVEVQPRFAPYLGAILLAGGAGALAAGAVALLFARRISLPLRALARATGHVGAGERADVAVSPRAVLEVRELADAFTQMAHALADAREVQRTFLLSVSHELKTPLTAIAGYAEAIEDRVAAPDAAARTIGMEARRLDRLVDDLLELGRAGRVGFEVRDEQVDLATIGRDAVERHAPQARLAGVALELTAEGPARARGDRDRIAQALSNLVENALRVTPTGGRITVSAAPGRLSVHDTGPGLDEADLQHAFERFYLHDRHRGARPVGSGLGLAIVAELVKAMGGRAEASSTPGDGATFSLILAPATRPG